jgi:hypothetical protein
VIEIVNGVVIGPLTHRAALCFNGKEVAASSVFESEEEAMVWGKEEWTRLQERVGVDELKRIGWVTPELRYWP